MGDKCTLTVNGKQLRVSLGETLVDAGLAARMLIPHDCCSGQCDTCLVRVVSGDVDPQGSDDGDLVRACQATIEGDAEILFDEVPVPAKRQGTLAAMRWLSHEVAEVVVRLNSPFTYLPGQYVKAAFAGFPSRDYSPTAYLDAVAASGRRIAPGARARAGGAGRDAPARDAVLADSRALLRGARPRGRVPVRAR